MSAPAFRPLRREELDLALSWAAQEGWNPGLHDAEAFWQADPEGFHGMDWGGELIGCASTVVYEGRLGFVGLFIVRPEWRGRGWGRAFWGHFIAAMQARLGPLGGAALDGVFTMQPAYAASGFAFTHRNLRMEGIGAPLAHSSPPEVCDAASLSLEALLAFDREHFGASRPAFLDRWRSLSGGKALAWVEEGRIDGFGVIRPCRNGFKIGPLFARAPQKAEALFAALSAHAAGQPLFLDTPENNPAALELAARHGLHEVFGCARMVSGAFPLLPWGAIYGVTTFELG